MCIRDRSITEALALQPRARGLPLVVITGAVLSSVHVAVREAVEVLPQASRAVNVLVCERSQPVLVILLLVNVTVGVPQASVAVAVPNAPSITEELGLQPRARGLPLVVITGAVLSSVHVCL